MTEYRWAKLGVYKDELLAELRCPYCAGPLLPAPLDGHEDCFRRVLILGARRGLA